MKWRNCVSRETLYDPRYLCTKSLPYRRKTFAHKETTSSKGLSDWSKSFIKIINGFFSFRKRIKTKCDSIIFMFNHYSYLNYLWINKIVILWLSLWRFYFLSATTSFCHNTSIGQNVQTHIKSFSRNELPHYTRYQDIFDIPAILSVSVCSVIKRLITYQFSVVSINSYYFISFWCTTENK